MEWAERLNHAVNYIEEHLREKIDYEKLAEIAVCPPYHFQRMFFYMTGITLAEYIRRRRMSLAAVDLQGGQMKVIDVALKYGYDSPTAFNRAFQSVHKVAPSQVKKEKVLLKSYPPVRFSLAVLGLEELNFKVERKEAFRILGISCPLSHRLEENFGHIPARWDAALADGTLAKLAHFMDGQPYGYLGASVHNEKEWKYFIAVCSKKTADGFESYEIPAAKWAIFSGSGTNRSLQELERRVIMEWLPTSGYEYANIPDMEVYIKADPQDMVYEYWLPVIKREDEDGCFDNEG